VTTSRQFADSEGNFQSWQDHPATCTKMVDREGVHTTCGAIVHYRAWESSDGAYVDYQYRCEAGHTWWIDGDDG